jgi:undecaprenyl-diphosphatase
MGSWDEQLFRACYGGGGGGWALGLMIAASIIGSGWTMVALLPLLLRRQSRSFASALTVTLLVTAVAVFLLKGVIGRVRPPLALSGVHALFGTPTDFSFPSGHAAGAFATATFVGMVSLRQARLEPARALQFRALAGAMVALAATIGYSRIYLGMHFPFDVMAGALLGSVLGSAGAWNYGKRRRTLALAPSPDDGAD